MFYYSDIILSKRPWSYCRLNEPLNSVVFLDQTGNNNHLFSKREFINNSWVYETITINQIDNENVGDIDSKSISILNEPITFTNNINWDFFEFKLLFDIPEFLTDYSFYRRGIKIQNPLDIKYMWMEFVLTDYNPEIYFSETNDAFSIMNAFDSSSLKLDQTIVDIEGFLGVTGERCLINLTTHYSFVFYNLEFIFGPIYVFSTTINRYDENSFSYYQTLQLEFYIDKNKVHSIILKDRIWNGINFDLYSNTFFDGSHRITIGLSQNQVGFIVFHISLDGDIAKSIEIETDINLSQYENYKNIGFIGNLQLSNISLFFNEPFPTDEWLNSTQQLFLYNKPIEQLESTSSRFQNEDHPFPKIENYLGSFNQFLDSLFFFGSKHNIIKSYNRNEIPVIFDIFREDITPELPAVSINDEIIINNNEQFFMLGVWKVDEINNDGIFIIPSETSESQIFITVDEIDYHAKKINGSTGRVFLELKYNHNFRIGEYVLIDYIKPKTLFSFEMIEGGVFDIYFENEEYDCYSYSGEICFISLNNYPSNTSDRWIVSQLHADRIEIIFNGLQNNTVKDENLIIKKLGLGGSRVWKKLWIDNKVLFSAKKIQDGYRHLLCDDSLSEYFTQFNLTDENLTEISTNAYFLKNIKNALTKPKLNNFSAFGDAHRFYLFVSSKVPSVSYSQILGYGELSDITIQNNFSSFLIGYSDNTILTNTNFNFAFQYPYWRILESGHLLCQSDSSNRKSETKTIYDNMVNINISDSAFHIFPDNFEEILNARFSDNQGMGEIFSILSYYDNLDFYQTIDTFIIEEDSQNGTSWYGNVELPDSNEIIFPDKINFLSNTILYRIGTRRIPISSIVKNGSYWDIITEQEHNLNSFSWFEKILGSTKGTLYNNFDIISPTGYYYGDTNKYVVQLINSTSFKILLETVDIDNPDPFVYDPLSGYDKMYITVPVFFIHNVEIEEKTGPDMSGNSIYKLRVHSEGMANGAILDVRVQVGQISTFTYF